MPRPLALPAGRRKRVTVVLCVLAALAAAALVIVFTGSSAPPKVVAADLSGRPTACMAADATTADKNPDTSRTWAAMQHGGLGRKVNIQQLVLPATSPLQVRADLAGLLAQHCSLVVTVGAPYAQAIDADQHLSPTTRFIAVDASPAAAPTAHTVTTVNGAAATTHVQQAVAGLARTH